MSIMPALMQGVPFTAITSAVTTAVNGTAFAMPFKSTPLLNILAVPTGSVSAFSYDVQASVDGTTYVTIAAAVTTQPLLTALKHSRSYPIIRINQVSRTGGTSNAIIVTLSQS